ncbi:WD40/YVTN/BNR-like repeat-containing protein [Occallatibacter savannae]|uniref:WD40/YVTN/BNR-like repeat-containing protein n=1 Tax=Occallatibacter savannae TaxID=1002691 RepID=UPI001EF6E108|nr:glycoside hydrolase [Occallatibacter savannae]
MKRLHILVALSLFSLSASVQAQVDPKLFSDMRWREIGPLRAGRTRALAGVPSEPATFYLGAVNGGVWKTTDAGSTWHSIWDEQSSGSIGAIAVSLSDPNTIYVGSGEGLQRPDLSTGDGVYKSTDAGKTWTHLDALRDGQQIGQLAIDPHDPNRLFVAVEGHPYGPNQERGLFRSTDGGKTFQRVLFVSDRTGASEVQIDPQHPQIVFAGMWQRQEAPWENGAFDGTEGGLYRSTDGGDHWTKLSGNGLPDQILQVQLTISPTNPKRIYGAIAAVHGPVGIYRSDDGGDHWVHTPDDDARPEERIGGGDVPVPVVDPKDPDTVYVASIVCMKSTDAGKTWTALRGSPGGDDYQNVFVNPNNTRIIALASDQGVVVSQNGGESWAEWYNQGTAQMYHATTDNAFPYRVCGGQQDSGSACVPSRSNDGRITFHDWHPAGIEEYGYAAPDPLDPDIVYGGKVTRYDRRTGQIQNVEPKPLRSYRVLRTEPLQFSPVDPHKLYFAANTLWLTENGGNDWKEISPDLSRETWELPGSAAAYKESPAAKASRRGVIYALGLSSLDVNRIWAGTDDGLIWTTTDGAAHWANVTPPELKPFWKVFNMDAGHFDAQTAYAAVNTLRLDDMRAHLFRTHDGGKSWTEIDNGIPNGAATSAIREDPKRKGLLFAGSETQVYVSFDDGDHWQSLRLNMPASSVRDLEIKNDDLIAATHGRGFIILDDITPLRQIAAETAAEGAHLYKPQTALRVRNDMNPPTPWPADFPATPNPPDGAVIDYYLGPGVTGVVSLEIADSQGQTIARFNSNDPVPPADPRYPDPIVWARPARVLSSASGHHRFLWNMQYPQVPGMSTSPDDDLATPHNTPPVSTAPWVLPGDYSVRLTANGKTRTEPLKIVMDPRVKTSQADLEKQFTAAKKMYEDLIKATAALHEISVLREQMEARKGQPVVGQSMPSIDSRLDAIAGPEHGPRGFGRGPAGPPTLASVRMQLARLEHSIENADEAPTSAQMEAFSIAEKPLAGLIEQWQQFKQSDLKALNAALQKHHLGAINLDTREFDRNGEDELEMGDEE